MKIFLMALFAAVTVFYVGWFIGFPVYRKLKYGYFFDGCYTYSGVLLILALVMNVISLVIRVI